MDPEEEREKIDKCVGAAWHDDDRCGALCGGMAATCEELVERVAALAMKNLGVPSQDVFAACITSARIAVAKWLIDGAVVQLHDTLRPDDRPGLADVLCGIVTEICEEYLREVSEGKHA